jgi:hypothetical protein
LFILGITGNFVLSKILITICILKLLTKYINMYFLKHNKQIYFGLEQVKASGECIQNQGKRKLVYCFQQTCSIEPVLQACHCRINIF